MVVWTLGAFHYPIHSKRHKLYEEEGLCGLHYKLVPSLATAFLQSHGN